MQWIAPSGKDAVSASLEKQLGAAADQRSQRETAVSRGSGAAEDFL